MRSFIGFKALLSTVIVIGLAGPVAAEDAPGAVRSITVIGQGEAAGSPDRATVNAGVQTLAPTVTESTQQNQAIVERIMKALRDEGIEARDLQTADYSVWPEQHHDVRGTGEVTITGYRVNNTVRITVRDIDRLGRVLAAVTDAGANAIHGIGFSVEDRTGLEARARAAAVADARSQAEALAGLASVQLGDVLRISTVPGSGYPGPMMGGGMEVARSASVPGISTGELSVHTQVQVTWEIRRSDD